MNDWRVARPRSINSPIFIALIFTALILDLSLSCNAATATPDGSTNPLLNFPDDYYKVTGSPDISASVERSSVYQDEETSIFLTLINRGSVTSIRVNNDPDINRPDQAYAASMELNLERGRTTAQDVSVRLRYTGSGDPLKIKREVAYAGNLLEGQVSGRLEFPVEVYEKTPPGKYALEAVINYTYQMDVAVEEDSDRPQNPDIFYLYKSKSQIVPIEITVERKSDVDLQVTSQSPDALEVGSKDNILEVEIENRGADTAKDLVARLRPESGIYVSVDESPIQILKPKDSAKLVYKVDVSKDAVAGKNYSMKLLFEFSDSFRKDNTDDTTFYVQLKPAGPSHVLYALAGILIIVLAIGLYKKSKRKGQGP